MAMLRLGPGRKLPSSGRGHAGGHVEPHPVPCQLPPDENSQWLPSAPVLAVSTGLNLTLTGISVPPGLPSSTTVAQNIHQAPLIVDASAGEH